MSWTLTLLGIYFIYKLNSSLDLNKKCYIYRQGLHRKWSHMTRKVIQFVWMSLLQGGQVLFKMQTFSMMKGLKKKQIMETKNDILSTKMVFLSVWSLIFWRFPPYSGSLEMTTDLQAIRVGLNKAAGWETSAASVPPDIIFVSLLHVKSSKPHTSVQAASMLLHGQ